MMVGWPYLTYFDCESILILRQFVGGIAHFFHSAKVEIPIEYDHIYIYIYMGTSVAIVCIHGLVSPVITGLSPIRDLETNVRKAVNPF